ncbi:MAG: hypothetical protein K2X91_13735, partial [Thermoleophilia bacterium]|nr:hypothetical protein [Thermoleophilia bacterium]
MHRRLPLVLAPVVAAVAFATAALGTGLPLAPWGAGPSPGAVASIASVAPSPAQTAASRSEPPPARPTGAPTTPSILDRARIAPRLQAALDAGRTDLAAPGIVASVLFPDGWL